MEVLCIYFSNESISRVVLIWLKKKGNISVLVDIYIPFRDYRYYIFPYINIYLYHLCKYEFINFYVYQHKI